MHRFLCGLSLLLVFLAPCLTRAEDIRPGTYKGTYHIDRWRQHRFDFLFVHPKLKGQLQEHAGHPLVIDATKIVQPMNPGGAIIYSVDGIRRDTPRVMVEVQWITPEGDGTSLRRGTAGKPLEVRIKVKNISGEPFELSKHQIELLLRIHVPSAPGPGNKHDIDPLGFWAGHNSVDTIWVRAFNDEDLKTLVPRDLTTCEASFPLHGGDETIDLATYHSRGSRQSPRLAPGETDFFTVRIENIPPNEYELAATVTEYRGATDRVTTVSRSLLYDALQQSPKVWHDVAASLMTRQPYARVSQTETPVTISFANLGDITRILYLPRHEGKIDFSNALLCFDEDGQRILPPVHDGHDYERILLAPGKQQSFEANLPPQTKLARLAWLSGVSSLKDKGLEDAQSLPYGFVFSQHVYLEKPPKN